jgi:hypothetical protein
MASPLLCRPAEEIEWRPKPPLGVIRTCPSVAAPPSCPPIRHGTSAERLMWSCPYLRSPPVMPTHSTIGTSACVIPYAHAPTTPTLPLVSDSILSGLWPPWRRCRPKLISEGCPLESILLYFWPRRQRWAKINSILMHFWPMASIQFRPRGSQYDQFNSICSVLPYGVNSISAYKAAIGQKYIKIELNWSASILMDFWVTGPLGRN